MVSREVKANICGTNVSVRLFMCVNPCSACCVWPDVYWSSHESQLDFGCSLIGCRWDETTKQRNSKRINGWRMDSPLTINISMNGNAMKYIRETVSQFPCPKLEIKKQNACILHDTRDVVGYNL